MSVTSRTMLRSMGMRSTRTFQCCQTPIRRQFITIPGTELQTLTESRILPYKSSDIYDLISNVDSYSTFLPFCTSSKVTKWSRADENGCKWPAEAYLTVGVKGIEETFTSKLLCVPGSIVEALGGEATTLIPRAKLSHYGEMVDKPAAENSIFQSLNTTWSIKPFHYKPPSGNPRTDKSEHPARDQTEVHLTIEFQFWNPIYGATSKAITPQIAPKMIEAFELRAKQLLGGRDIGAGEKTTFDHAVSAAKKMGA